MNSDFHKVALKVRDFLSLAGVPINPTPLQYDSLPNILFIYGNPENLEESKGIKFITTDVDNYINLYFYEGQEFKIPIAFINDDRLIQNTCKFVKDIIRAQLHNYN